MKYVTCSELAEQINAIHPIISAQGVKVAVQKAARAGSSDVVKKGKTWYITTRWNQIKRWTRKAERLREQIKKEDEIVEIESMKLKIAEQKNTIDILHKSIDRLQARIIELENQLSESTQLDLGIELERDENPRVRKAREFIKHAESMSQKEFAKQQGYSVRTLQRRLHEARRVLMGGNE